MSKRRSKGTPAAAWFAGTSFRRHEQPTVKVQVLELVPPAPAVDTVLASDPILPPSPPAEGDPWADEPTTPGWPRGSQEDVA